VAYRLRMASYESSELAALSREIGVRVVGEAALSELAQAMLDLEVAPFRLARADGQVGELLEPVRRQMAAYVASLGDSELASLTEHFPATGYRRDIALSLSMFAVWDAYFALPKSIFETEANRESKVLAAIPALEALTDPDGLLRLNGLQVSPEGVFVDDAVVSFHQLLRRDFSGNVNEEVLRTLLEGVATREIDELRIAIDDRRLHLAREHRVRIEKEFWYGPHLRGTDLDRLDGSYPVITVHGRAVGVEANPMDRYDRFAVRWSLGPDPGEKTMEAEELVEPERAQRGDLVPLRYAHAIRDTSTHTFRHVDGAVRTYSPEAYVERREMEFATAASNLNSHYRKVFRADGKIGTQRWADIIAAWFRGNELTLEYLATL
jgi:hypothetical protein